MELSKIAKIINVLLKLFLVFGVGSMFFLKGVIEYLGVSNVLGYTIVYSAISVFCLYIVYQIIKVFKSIELGDPFVTKNEIALKKISVSCELIALLLLIKLIAFRDGLIFMSVIFMVVFLIAGLCTYVFSQLFKLSAIIKEENDMTV